MIAHLDIKPDNFLITDDYRLVLTGFNFTQPCGIMLNDNIGTTQYQPPEIV